LNLRYDYAALEGGESAESLLDPRSLTPVERARKKRSKVSLPPPCNVKQVSDWCYIILRAVSWNYLKGVCLIFLSAIYQLFIKYFNIK